MGPYLPFGGSRHPCVPCMTPSTYSRASPYTYDSRPPPPPACVQYLDVDGVTPLKDTVAAARVRPLPPASLKFANLGEVEVRARRPRLGGCLWDASLLGARLLGVPIECLKGRLHGVYLWSA